MESLTFTLDGDNLLTAARRVIRNIRADDQAHGGLLSKETIMAGEILARHVEDITSRITITKEPTNANT